MFMNFLCSVSVVQLESRPQVSGQPIFVETLEKTTEVVESSLVRLEVIIVGNPPPKVGDLALIGDPVAMTQERLSVS